MDVRIRLLWLPQAQFAGYLLAERESRLRGKGPRIICQGADLSIGPAAALLRGECEFAVASPAHILESGAPADLVWLLTIQQESPLVYPVSRTSGIESPADLSGCRVAVWPGNEDLELQWMIARAGLDANQVTRLPVADTVAAYLAGEAECAQMTSYHELHQLEAALPGRGEFRLLRAADQGIGILKDGLIARRDFVEENETLVEDVVCAVLAGWTLAFADSEAAVEACLAARPELGREDQARQLEDIRVLSRGGATQSHGLGYPDPAHAENALAAARETGLQGPFVTASEMRIRRFWHAAPSAFRRQAI
ncbi:MAG: ABC transporter substrate-binding protein [bacterium]|nr:ABC transporter substrate-binding protein [bacterium]